MSHITNILRDFPPSSQNNAREIVRGYLEKFEKSPSDRIERKLDELGIPGDHDDYLDNISEIVRNNDEIERETD